MTIPPLRLCAALLLFAGAAPLARAQTWSNAEIERGLRFPGTPTHDAEPYTQRYGYSTGNGIFFINGNARQQQYLDYLDRLDRAQKFGYPIPVDPFFGQPPVVEGPVAEGPPPAQPVRVFFGGGLGWFRRR